MKTLIRGAMLVGTLLSVGCGGPLDGAPAETPSPAEGELQSQEQRVYACSDGVYTVNCKDTHNCCFSATHPYCSPYQCP